MTRRNTLEIKSLDELPKAIRMLNADVKVGDKAKGNKFGAKKKMVDGIEFDSTKEAERYMLLRAQEREGLILNLKVHVPIHVELRRTYGNDIRTWHAFDYECDFVYDRPDGLRDWSTVHEDSKGYRKGSAYQLFRLKAAVIKAALGIHIEEV